MIAMAVGSPGPTRIVPPVRQEGTCRAAGFEVDCEQPEAHVVLAQHRFEAPPHGPDLHRVRVAVLLLDRQSEAGNVGDRVYSDAGGATDNDSDVLLASLPSRRVGKCGRRLVV